MTSTVRRKQVAIFGSYKENPYLDPLYIAELESISDPNKRAAWLEGDWDIVAGGALDDVWRKQKHILPRFPCPQAGASIAVWIGVRRIRVRSVGSLKPTAKKRRSNLDDGSTAHVLPAAWFANPNRRSVSNRKGWFEQGACAKAPRRSRTRQGLRSPVNERRLVESQPWPGPADNQIRDVRESDVDTIEKKMADKGVRWESRQVARLAQERSCS
jgi:hypothetical protein